MTKVAPAADVELLSSIYKAVGPSFLQRLLLPLREVRGGGCLAECRAILPCSGLSSQDLANIRLLQGSKPVANAGDMVSFGISIWAKLVDLPEVARSDEVKSLIPLLLKVSLGAFKRV